jgi:hypothetical protein
VNRLAGDARAVPAAHCDDPFPVRLATPVRLCVEAAIEERLQFVLYGCLSLFLRINRACLGNQLPDCCGARLGAADVLTDVADRRTQSSCLDFGQHASNFVGRFDYRCFGRKLGRRVCLRNGVNDDHYWRYCRASIVFERFCGAQREQPTEARDPFEYCRES